MVRFKAVNVTDRLMHIANVSIPEWFDLKALVGGIEPLFPWVSIPEWFDLKNKVITAINL